MSCPFLPEENANPFLGIFLGVCAYYCMSSMSPLEWILILRILSLVLLAVAIYLYCKMQLHPSESKMQMMIITELAEEPSSEVFPKKKSETFDELQKEPDNSNLSTEKLEEVEEIVKTPTPPASPKEESAEFADIVKPKKTATKRRNNAT